MNVALSIDQKGIESTALQITGSKSESNRLLILQAFYPNLEIENLSGSDDTQVLQKALSKQKGTIDVHHAGTAMRFLTAYFAVKEGVDVELTGSERMQQRPIGILVDTLRQLGAQIAYKKEEGFPPLHIRGKKLKRSTVSLKADVSSQFISALLLVAPSLENGIEIQLEGEITSRPYIEMTLSLLQLLGVPFHFIENKITVRPFSEVEPKKITVESDWSSASYFYSLVALSDNLEISLKSYKAESLQGDSALIELYDSLGVATIFNEAENELTLKKSEVQLPKVFKKNLTDTPDIAQTIAVTCLGLGIGCALTGLHTLKIKETDRLQALKNEIEKMGGKVTISKDSLTLTSTKKLIPNVAVGTYNDHRMAMAFAPLAVKIPIQINDAGVVSKSFPDFWDAMENIGLSVKRS